MRTAIIFLLAVGGVAAQITVPTGFGVASVVSASALKVPAPLGGIEFVSNGSVLLVGGSANAQAAAAYALPVLRSALTHRIKGFGPATSLVLTPRIDGGLEYGPRGTLFYTVYPGNALGQIVGTWSVSSPLPSTTRSVGGLTFVPVGLPRAGQLLVSSYEIGDLFTVSLIAHSTGTFSVSGVTLFAALPAGTEGFRFIPTGPTRGTSS